MFRFDSSPTVTAGSPAGREANRRVDAAGWAAASGTLSVRIERKV